MEKLSIDLQPDNLAGAATETVWAEPQGKGVYQIKNTPFLARGLSFEDLVEAKPHDGLLTFEKVVKHNGHSSYQVYLIVPQADPRVVALMEAIGRLRCEPESASENLFSIDVPPEADIHAVYNELERAEKAGFLKFQEGHCGHKMTT